MSPVDRITAVPGTAPAGEPRIIDEPTRRVEYVMGTAVSLAATEPVPPEAFDRAFGWLHRVDRVYSTYKPDSQISRLRRGELDESGCDPDVRVVLKLCERLRTWTGGYFDAAPAGRAGLDPSGLVKGWAAERASAILAGSGVRASIVNAGGDVRLRGSASGGEPWRVGISDPYRSGELLTVVTGRDVAVATSGSYERGDHVLDPHTGEPARDLVAVTVVGPSLTWADAFATAAVAMGRARAAGWLAGLPRYAGLLAGADGDVRYTPGFARYLAGRAS
jgi:thiamine biosynthesis lipoprotein